MGRVTVTVTHYHGDTFSFYVLILNAQSQLIYDFKSFFHKYMYPMHSNDCFPNAHFVVVNILMCILIIVHCIVGVGPQ